MPRSRNIKPGFFKNDALAELPALTRILFAGMWTIADREGRLEDRPKRIKAECLPYDDCDVDAALADLAKGPDPFILRYEAGGAKYIQISSWAKHQSPHHKEEDSDIPCLSQASVKHEPSKSQARTEPDAERGHAPVKGISNKVKGIKEESTRNQGVDLSPIVEESVREAAGRWLAYKAERREKYKPASLKALVTRLNNLASDHGTEAVVDAIGRAMANGWKGFDHGVGKTARGSPGTPAQSRTDKAITKFLGMTDGDPGSDSDARKPALRLEGPPGG